jgi:hypothetical protein
MESDETLQRVSFVSISITNIIGIDNKSNSHYVIRSDGLQAQITRHCAAKLV